MSAPFVAELLKRAELEVGCAWADMASAAPAGVPYGRRESLERLQAAAISLAASLVPLLVLMRAGQLPPPEANGDITVHPPLGERCFTKEELS